MKKDVMQKWVKALRSGKYKQATEQLKDGNSYCCLGVLCDISKQGKWYGAGYEVNEEFDDAKLPVAIRKWAGIKVRSANGNIPSVKKSLVHFNDTAKKNFKEIADIIEKNYKEL